jgi:hypothetical protein
MVNAAAEPAHFDFKVTIAPLEVAVTLGFAVQAAPSQLPLMAPARFEASVVVLVT